MGSRKQSVETAKNWKCWTLPGFTQIIKGWDSFSTLIADQGACGLMEIFIKVLQAIYPVPVSRTEGLGGVGAETRCY